LTTIYNIARLREDQGRLLEAEEIYKGLLKQHPQYLDCNDPVTSYYVFVYLCLLYCVTPNFNIGYMRLGVIYRTKGMYDEAAEYFRVNLLLLVSCPCYSYVAVPIPNIDRIPS
jgi:tetratricopeptide (TPR) repeat protein